MKFWQLPRFILSPLYLWMKKNLLILEEKFVIILDYIFHSSFLFFISLILRHRTQLFFILFIFILFFAIAINNQFHKSDSLTRRSLLLKRWWKFSCSSSFHTKYAKCWRGSFLCWDGKKINAAPRKKGTKSLVFTLHFTQSHHIQMLLLLLLFPFFTLL